MPTLRQWHWIGAMALAWAIALAAKASAAELKIQVNDDKGHPVSNAVVTVLPQNAAARGFCFDRDGLIGSRESKPAVHNAKS